MDAMTLDRQTSDIGQMAFWNLIYAVYVMVVEETKEGLERQVWKWKKIMESFGLSLNIKMEYFGSEDDMRTMQFEGKDLTKVQSFK